MPRRLPAVVKEHLEKARESALLAVEVYNKPATKFKSGGFIVLMVVAWTSLFHAIFFRRKIKPFYRDKDNPRRYKKIAGDYKAWELSTCVKKYYTSRTTPERSNIEFFIGLRNKVEHRSMPALDSAIFGECQAFLFNFEDLLFREFGPKYMLHEAPTLALQFSHLRHDAQAKAVSRLQGKISPNISQYVDDFRSSLETDLLHDMRYSYKVFLIPKVVNHPGQADVAVEYVKYDPSKPDEMEKYDRLVTLIKPATTQVVNPGKLRPGEIAKAVEPIVKQVVGPHVKFNASYHHVLAYRFYNVRPPKGKGDPRKTDIRYCHYDEAHRDYVYTEAWKKFLIREMKKPGQYERLIKAGSAKENEAAA